MGIQQKSILIALLIFLIPTTPFASDIETGYDLYRYIKIAEDYNPQSTQKSPSEKDFFNAMYAMGYLTACLDTLTLTQNLMLENMFPINKFTEKEREKLSKQINFTQVNIPENGIPAEQLILIYIKYAKKYPEKLSGSARVCVLLSLIDAYGWK